MENKAISSDLIRGHIDTIILYSLLDGQKTSQQIIDSVYEKSDNKYQLNQATLYSSLKRLESLKLISSVWHDADDGRRKFFKLTDDGKNTVSANLSNWEYSRAIIDKLIGFNNSDISDNNVRVVEVEKIVEKPVYIEKVVEKPVTVYDTQTNAVANQNATENIVKTSIQQPESVTEANFRNILNGLIKANEKPKQETAELPIAEDVQVKNFNETINDVENFYKNTTNKIDFTDLKEKVEQDGYKLSVSTKENKIKTGTLYINKLNLFSALAMSIVALLEFLIFSVCTKGLITYDAWTVIIVVLLIAVLPITFFAVFRKNPLKTSQSLKKDGVLYSAIIAFNLILFTVVLNLLFGVDLGNKTNLALFLILPIILIIDCVLYYLIRYALSPIKSFTSKKR